MKRTGLKQSNSGLFYLILFLCSNVFQAIIVIRLRVQKAYIELTFDDVRGKKMKILRRTRAKLGFQRCSGLVSSFFIKNTVWEHFVAIQRIINIFATWKLRINFETLA